MVFQSSPFRDIRSCSCEPVVEVHAGLYTFPSNQHEMAHLDCPMNLSTAVFNRLISPSAHGGRLHRFAKPVDPPPPPPPPRHSLAASSGLNADGRNPGHTLAKSSSLYPSESRPHYGSGCENHDKASCLSGGQPVKLLTLDQLLVSHFYT